MSADTASRGRARGILLGAVLVGAALQASRLPFRWGPIPVAYASYFKEYRHAIEVEGWHAALTTFVGLHPPAYSLVFLSMMALAVAPLAWLVTSGVFSVSSVAVVWAVAKRGWGAGVGAAAAGAAFVLAISPHRNAYGLEPNNYPMLVLTTSLQLLAFAAWVGRDGGEAADVSGCGAGIAAAARAGRLARDLALAAGTVLALYTHVLSITLPAAELLALLPRRGRKLLPRFAVVQAIAALPCLPLLPAILEGGSSPPMNAPPGLAAAAAAVLLRFPTRYGSTAGTLLVAAALVLGAMEVLRGGDRRGPRTIPLSWLIHATLTLLLVGWMVSAGIAADHQFPYYVAVLPSGALLAGSALVRPAFGTPLPRQFAALALVVGLLLHAGAAGLDFARARAAWLRAPIDRGMVALAVREWGPGSALLLVGFPSYGDDDKDAIDPAWALVPMTRRVHFDHPGVGQLVTADPYWGQPLRMGDRWLYTFTQVDADRIGAIASHHLGRGQRVLLALYDTDGATDDVREAERWAAQAAGPGRRAPGQALWIVDPP